MDVRQMAKALGRRGGQARARRLSAEQRKQIAALGAQARLRSLEAADRIAANLRFALLVREFQGGAPAVKRTRTFRGQLPGVYPARV